MKKTQRDRIPVRITKLDDLYCGKKTGHVVFHTEVVGGCHPMGAVLGRGDNEIRSMEDFVFRDRSDGHDVRFDDLDVVKRESHMEGR